MNTLQLLQAATSAYLKVADPAELPANAKTDFLRCINGAQAEVWRKLPLHYRRKPIVLEFPGQKTGTLKIGADSISLSEVTFPGLTDPETYRYSTITVAGDANENEFQVTKLLSHWRGSPPNTTQQAILFGNAVVVPYLVETIVFPLREPGCYHEWRDVKGFTRNWPSTSYPRQFQMDRLTTEDGGATRFRLKPNDGFAVPPILEGIIEVAPQIITLQSSQRPVELEYDDETANFIIGLAGTHLMTHRFFDSERLNAALVRESAALVREQLSLLPQNPGGQTNSIGTPYGF